MPNYQFVYFDFRNRLKFKFLNILINFVYLLFSDKNTKAIRCDPVAQFPEDLDQRLVRLDLERPNHDCLRPPGQEVGRPIRYCQEHQE